MLIKVRQLVIGLVLVTLLVSACSQATVAPQQIQVTETTIAEESVAEPTNTPEAEPVSQEQSTATAMPTEPTPTEANMQAADDILPAVDPASVSGDIVTAGSSTVFPLSEAMAERFKNEGYTGKITIDSIGTGAGFERFCVSGETDISNASRTIKDSEAESCRSIGREPVEFRVGTDAIAVVVSAENDFLTDLSMDQLALAFSTAEKWSDIDPSWPAENILRYIPGTDSGTFDYFVEKVFDKDEGPILSATNTQLSEDDNVLVQGVEGSPYAIGFFGYAYYQENASQLKTVSLDGIAPSFETAESGEYPLSRPLFIYSDAKIMQEKPQVASFINFYLTFVNDEIGKVGYFPASEEALNQSKNTWLASVGE